MTEIVRGLDWAIRPRFLKHWIVSDLSAQKLYTRLSVKIALMLIWTPQWVHAGKSFLAICNFDILSFLIRNDCSTPFRNIDIIFRFVSKNRTLRLYRNVVLVNNSDLSIVLFHRRLYLLITMIQISNNLSKYVIDINVNVGWGPTRQSFYSY